MGILNVGPSTPTESSTGVPVGGFSQWFRDIGNWIKGMSPNGSTDYDTGWVTVPLATGFQSLGADVVVRRIGREIFWRGMVQPTSGSFATGTVIQVTAAGGIPASFRPPGVINRMASAGSANQTARIYVRTEGDVTLVTGPAAGSYYDVSALSGYLVD